MAKGRHVRRRRMRAALIVAAIVGVLFVVAGGVSLAAYRYEQSRADRILPGVTVAGVDVSGMTRREAVRAVRAGILGELDRTIAITVGSKEWGRAARDLGRRADVGSAVDAAFAVGDSMGALDRFWHRFNDQPVRQNLDVIFSTWVRPIDRLVRQIASEVRVEPTEAAMGINTDGTDIRFTRARAGSKLAENRATAAIAAALESGAPSVDLPTKVVDPVRTASDLGRTIVVWVDRNELQLYHGFQVEKTYSVATAKPGYVTPTGVWTIWDKRENPTWYNPALDTWGADLPPSSRAGRATPWAREPSTSTRPG